VAASIDDASREQISLLAGDRVTASSREPGSFRVSTKKSKNGATSGTPLEPGKFGLTDNCHHIGCCDSCRRRSPPQKPPQQLPEQCEQLAQPNIG